MSPRTLLFALGAVFLGLSSASLMAGPPDLGKGAGGTMGLDGASRELPIGQSVVTLWPSPPLPKAAEKADLGVPLGVPGETIPSILSGSGGLDFESLRIPPPVEIPHSPPVTLTGDPGLFTGSSQFTQVTDRGANANWLRETKPEGPGSGVMNVLWTLPVVFFLLAWLLRGFEETGRRRRRSSSRRTPSPQTAPRRSR